MLLRGTRQAGIPAAAVTAKDLLDELKGLRQDLTRVLVHMEGVDTRNVTADKAHADYETRIRSLEQFRYKLAGMAILAGGLSGYVGYLLGHAGH